MVLTFDGRVLNIFAPLDSSLCERASERVSLCANAPAQLNVNHVFIVSHYAHLAARCVQSKRKRLRWKLAHRPERYAPPARARAFGRQMNHDDCALLKRRPKVPLLLLPPPPTTLLVKFNWKQVASAGARARHEKRINNQLMDFAREARACDGLINALARASRRAATCRVVNHEHALSSRVQSVSGRASACEEERQMASAFDRSRVFAAAAPAPAEAYKFSRAKSLVRGCDDLRR